LDIRTSAVVSDIRPTRRIGKPNRQLPHFA
jgi:hypothetical protein